MQACFDALEDLVQSANAVRARIVRVLVEYIEVSATMRTLEETFGTRILHTAAQLNELITQRRRLEAECRRIQDRLDRGEYAQAEDLHADVRAALTPTDTEHPDAGTGSHSSERDGDVRHGDEEHARQGESVPDDNLDEATRKRILRDFKRVVLPNVHADTSDAPYTVFEVAYSAYKSRDYTLMEAFVIRYRGEIDPTKSGEVDGDIRARFREYQAAEKRLNARLHALRREAGESELISPDEVHRRMELQYQQFLRAIEEETERLLALRAQLEAMLAGPELPGVRGWTGVQR